MESPGLASRYFLHNLATDCESIIGLPVYYLTFFFFHFECQIHNVLFGMFVLHGFVFYDSWKWLMGRNHFNKYGYGTNQIFLIENSIFFYLVLILKLPSQNL